MAVNLKATPAAELAVVGGVSLGSTSAGVRSGDGDDLLVVTFAPGSVAAGVFTQNRFCAAPVTVCREHLEQGAGQIRALVVNAGNANAGTGASGLADARNTCGELAAQIGCEPSDILPMSTGVILEPLPMDKLLAGLPVALSAASDDNWDAAARAIMTTDTLPKAVSRQVNVNGQVVHITGVAKGAGMIRPDMATMLSFVATDAAIEPALLQQWIRDAADQSFNRITVDGDTSTNDSLLAVATGASGVQIKSASGAHADAVRSALFEVTRLLAQMVIRDGEGATKFISIHVEQASSQQEACAIAYSIAHSPLVKTAFFASDANLGRLLCAIGYANVPDLDVDRLELFLGDVLVAAEGGRHAAYTEEQGAKIMEQDEIDITVRLHRGDQDTTVWTCDLSHDYVKINAEYRT